VLTLVWYLLSMNVNTPTEAVRAWLEALPAEKKPIVEALRRLIEAAGPSTHEILCQETLRYRLTASGVGHLFYIAVFAAHVNLGFFFGGSLPDPERLLVGSGKRMRHVPIRSVQECENPAITSLLAQARADGLQRVEHLPQQGT
jgi:hypothetical protein